MSISEIRSTWRSFKGSCRNASRPIAKWILPEDQFYKFEARMSKGWMKRKMAYLQVAWVGVKKLWAGLKDLAKALKDVIVKK